MIQPPSKDSHSVLDFTLSILFHRRVSSLEQSAGREFASRRSFGTYREGRDDHYQCSAPLGRTRSLRSAFLLRYSVVLAALRS